MCTGEKVSAFNYRGAIKVHTNEIFRMSFLELKFIKGILLM